MRLDRRVIAVQLAVLTAVAPLWLGVTALPATAAVLGSTPSTVEVGSPELNPKPVGRTTTLTAGVQPSDATGSVTFYDDQAGTRMLIGSAPVVASGFGASASLPAPADMAVGTYHLVAVYSGDSTYAGSESSPVLTFVVGPRPVNVTLRVSGPHDPSGLSAQKGDALQVTVQAADVGSYSPNMPGVSGTVQVRLDGVEVATGGLSPVIPYSQIQFVISTKAWGLGAHALTASYDPGLNPDFAGSTSSNWNINLVPGAVDATGVGVQYTTFYPYKDGYRDTVAIRGVRSERASVAIRVYSPTGHLVKSAAVTAGTGPYAVSWNGRTSSGAMLAAGTYKVVQVLTDSTGSKLTVTSSVVLSGKRLATHTATITQKGSKYVLTEYTGVTTSSTAGWAHWVGSVARPAGVAWQFNLPSAVTYRSLTFRVEAKTRDGWMRMVHTGCGDFDYCSISPMDGAPVGNSTGSLAWYAATGSASLHRSGRLVRGVVLAYDKPIYLYLARLTVVYTLLK